MNTSAYETTIVFAIDAVTVVTAKAIIIIVMYYCYYYIIVSHTFKGQRQRHGVIVFYLLLEKATKF